MSKKNQETEVLDSSKSLEEIPENFDDVQDEALIVNGLEVGTIEKSTQDEESNEELTNIEEETNAHSLVLNDVSFVTRSILFKKQPNRERERLLGAEINALKDENRELESKIKNIPKQWRGKVEENKVQIDSLVEELTALISIDSEPREVKCTREEANGLYIYRYNGIVVDSEPISFPVIKESEISMGLPEPDEDNVTDNEAVENPESIDSDVAENHEIPLSLIIENPFKI